MDVLVVASRMDVLVVSDRKVPDLCHWKLLQISPLQTVASLSESHYHLSQKAVTPPVQHEC